MILRLVNSAILACAAGCLDPAKATEAGVRVGDGFSTNGDAGGFTAHPCPFASGQQVDANTCVDLKSPADSDRPTDAGDKRLSEPAGKTRRFCPTLVVRRRADGTVTSAPLPLPAGSNLYDLSNCCAAFTVATNPAAKRFSLSAGGRDCFGGTASFAIEEIYEIGPKISAAGTARLVKDNSVGLH